MQQKEVPAIGNEKKKLQFVICILFPVSQDSLNSAAAGVLADTITVNSSLENNDDSSLVVDSPQLLIRGGEPADVTQTMAGVSGGRGGGVFH